MDFKNQGPADERKQGTLKIFFGYAAGVGKTYAMLKAAHRASDVGRILRTFKIKKNVEVTDNGKIII